MAAKNARDADPHQFPVHALQSFSTSMMHSRADHPAPAAIAAHTARPGQDRYRAGARRAVALPTLPRACPALRSTALRRRVRRSARHGRRLHPDVGGARATHDAQRSTTAMTRLVPRAFDLPRATAPVRAVGDSAAHFHLRAAPVLLASPPPTAARATKMRRAPSRRVPPAAQPTRLARSKPQVVLPTDLSPGFVQQAF